MKKVKVSTNLSMSRIVHGIMRLRDWNLSKKEVLDLFKRNVDKGLTTLDHADIYGDYKEEEIFGEILSLDPSFREKIEIVTKCGIMLQSKNRPSNKVHYYDTSKEHIIKSANRSLKNMKIDYIDLLLIHRPDPLMDPREVASAFNQLKKEGKVKNFGVSNFLPYQFDMLQDFLDVPLVTNQVEISVTELKQFQNGTMEHCIKNNISPMAWSPVGGGDVFTENNERINRIKEVLYEVANNHGMEGIDIIMYAWLLKHPASIMPVIGTGKESRINAAIEATNIELTKQEWFKIYEASRGREVE